MAASVLVARNTHSAPKDYMVPGAQQITLLSVQAEVDGSGAAGDFLPALQVLSPAGDVLWTGVPNSAITAGGSVSVSWFPGVNAATAPTVLNIPNTVYQVKITAGASSTFNAPGTGDTTIGESHNYYPDTFDVYDAGGTSAPEVLEKGTYWWDIQWVPFSDSGHTTLAPTPEDVSVRAGGVQDFIWFVPGTSGSWLTYSNGQGQSVGVWEAAAGATFDVTADNASGSDVYVVMNIRLAKLDKHYGGD